MENQPGSTQVSRRVTQQGGLSRLDYCFHVNAYKHLTAKGLPAAVIQPKLKSNLGSCEETLTVFVMARLAPPLLLMSMCIKENSGTNNQPLSLTSYNRMLSDKMSSYSQILNHSQISPEGKMKWTMQQNISSQSQH